MNINMKLDSDIFSNHLENKNPNKERSKWQRGSINIADKSRHMSHVLIHETGNTFWRFNIILRERFIRQRLLLAIFRRVEYFERRHIR